MAGLGSDGAEWAVVGEENFLGPETSMKKYSQDREQTEEQNQNLTPNRDGACCRRGVYGHVETLSMYELQAAP